tara:strand:- start:5970 stop:7094 length:1125 start_codon:yes stop_codon:yes gene_type:complete
MTLNYHNNGGYIGLDKNILFVPSSNSHRSGITDLDYAKNATTPPSLYSMSFPHTFLSALAGKLGPTSYSHINRPTTDTNYFSLSGGYQLWKPPMTRDYLIYMRGATGGQHSGSWGVSYPGGGAEATFTIQLSSSKTYAIVVGQRPSSTSSGGYNGSAGGGASLIYENGYNGSSDLSKIIGIVGGGGGTGHGYQGQATMGVGRGGSSTTNSNELNSNAYVYVSAIGSNRASAKSCGNYGVGYGGRRTRFVTNYAGSGGGAGWLGDGEDYYHNSYMARGGDRWNGGDSYDGSAMDGGFGGGGASNGTGNAGGGGGGYTGGGAGDGWQSMSGAGINYNSWGGGAGGGTYINTAATGVSITAGANGVSSYFNGTVIVT